MSVCFATVMYHHDNMYVKVAYDNFDNERRYADDVMKLCSVV